MTDELQVIYTKTPTKKKKKKKKRKEWERERDDYILQPINYISPIYKKSASVIHSLQSPNYNKKKLHNWKAEHLEVPMIYKKTNSYNNELQSEPAIRCYKCMTAQFQLLEEKMMMKKRK